MDEDPAAARPLQQQSVAHGVEVGDEFAVRKRIEDILALFHPRTYAERMAKLRYRLDDLGCDGFEQFVAVVLKARVGLAVECWGGRQDWGRDAWCPDSLPYPTNKINPGPHLFQCKFVEEANAAGASPARAIAEAVRKECKSIVERKAKRGTWKTPRTFGFLTNARMDAGLKESVRKRFEKVLPKTRIILHDGPDLCAMVDKDSTIVRSFPQLLSLCDMRGLIRSELDAPLFARSEYSLKMMEEKATAFVPTHAYRRAWEILREHHYVILTGPPEAGKTTIGRVISLALAKDGWEFLECVRPEDFEVPRTRGKKRVCIADDFFGRGEFEPGRVSEWQRYLPHILPRLGADHWLILTSRAHLLQYAIPRLDVDGANDKFPHHGKVIVKAGDLSRGEKARMLYRHAKSRQLSETSRKWIKAEAKSIVDHAHFTPLRIERLVAKVIPRLESGAPPDAKEIEAEFDRAIADPSHEMKVTFGKLLPAHRWLLFARLDSEEEGRSSPATGTLERSYGSLCPPELMLPFERTVEEIDEAFLARFTTDYGSTHVDWIHPSVRDLTIAELAADPVARKRFLETCSEGGIIVACSIGGGAEGSVDLPLLIADLDWAAFESRCRVLVAQRGKVLLTIATRSDVLIRHSKNSASKNAGNRLRDLSKSLLPDAFKALKTATFFDDAEFFRDVAIVAATSERREAMPIDLWFESCCTGLLGFSRYIMPISGFNSWLNYVAVFIELADEFAAGYFRKRRRQTKLLQAVETAAEELVRICNSASNYGRSFRIHDPTTDFEQLADEISGCRKALKTFVSDDVTPQLDAVWALCNDLHERHKDDKADDDGDPEATADAVPEARETPVDIELLFRDL